MRELNEISGTIVDAAVRIHKALGPGLSESVYVAVLARDLARRGCSIERQKPVSFDFEEMWFEDAFRVDLVVDHAVLVEVKSVLHLSPVHGKQLLTYLRLLDHRLGLLLNFGAPVMKEGIVRIANRL